MYQILIVGIGGFLGTVARYKLSGLVLHHTVDWRFPLATFVVNVVGCLVAGVLSGLIERYGWFSPNTRLLLFTGILGGFTTFSAFGVETAYLLRRGEVAIAFTYVALSVLCGLGALLFAMKSVP
jgi:CrcB protein